MSTSFNSEQVADAVAGWAARSSSGLDIATAVGHPAENGSVTVELFTFMDLAEIRAEGIAQTGRIVRPSYVITVAARAES